MTSGWRFNVRYVVSVTCCNDEAWHQDVLSVPQAHITDTYFAGLLAAQPSEAPCYA
jgi:hypothetical protein